MLDLSDPYCTLGLHETEHRGATCRKTLNPTWEEEFEFRGLAKDDPREAHRLTLGALLQLPTPNPDPNPNPSPSPTLTLTLTLPLGELLQLPLELKVFDEDRSAGYLPLGLIRTRALARTKIGLLAQPTPNPNPDSAPAPEPTGAPTPLQAPGSGRPRNQRSPRLRHGGP